MDIKLVSITQPADRMNPVERMSPEELIVYTARVSSPANQDNHETAPRLLKYLIDHKHWSPFEMVDMTVELETSRAIAAQILRHRSFSFQEFSQRYSKASASFETPDPRRQDTKNRQNSTDDLPEETVRWFRDAQFTVCRNSYRLYEEALEKGIAKEQARLLLPMSIITRMYMKGSVRSWIHYLQVRTDPSTQKEHRDVALAIQRVFVHEFPHTATALGW